MNIRKITKKRSLLYALVAPFEKPKLEPSREIQSVIHKARTLRELIELQEKNQKSGLDTK